MKLIPYSKRDRNLVGWGLFNAVMSGANFWVGNHIIGILCATVAVGTSVLAYLFQDQTSEGTEASDYEAIIKRISSMGTQLKELGVFLEHERLRIADSEATVKLLAEEKAKLEPLVLTQRGTVEAILNAHAERTSKNVWKERLFGFALGTGASLVASFVYDHFKK